MNINAANAGIRPHFQPSPVEAPTVTEQLPPETSTEEPTTDSPKSGEVKGVMRLLQEGHFKGVADVRLRINFHEEISQLNAAAASAGAEAASESFTSRVSEDLATLVTALEATEVQSAVTAPEATEEQAVVTEPAVTEEQALAASDLAAGFEASLADLLNEISINEEADFGALEIALQSEADNFISELQTQLELESEDPLLADFAAAFADRLSQLGSAANSVADVLPELSEPKGNGAAYAKFVAILEGMNKAEPEPELQDVYA